MKATIVIEKITIDFTDEQASKECPNFMDPSFDTLFGNILKNVMKKNGQNNEKENSDANCDIQKINDLNGIQKAKNGVYQKKYTLKKDQGGQLTKVQEQELDDTLKEIEERRRQILKIEE